MPKQQILNISTGVNSSEAEVENLWQELRGNLPSADDLNETIKKGG